MPSALQLHICAAREVVETLRNAAAAHHPIGSVLSIESLGYADVRKDVLAEHPPPTLQGLQDHLTACGYAPRLQAWPEFQDVRQHILVFNDIETDRPGIGPHRDDVRTAYAQAQRHLLARPASPLLIHCAAGKSRSTALALTAMIAAEHLVSSRLADPVAMVDTLAALRPVATPNRLVVAYADDLFGYGGHLIDAVQRHPVMQANYALRQEQIRQSGLLARLRQSRLVRFITRRTR